jgi:hypothetical protein
MQSTEDRLRRMRQEIGDTRSLSQDGNAVDVFLALTLRNVMGSLTDLQQLSRALNNAPTAQTPCQLLNCPRGLQLQQAVKDTVDVLEETKGAFKSKTLADLRHRLELLLEHV